MIMDNKTIFTEEYEFNHLNVNNEVVQKYVYQEDYIKDKNGKLSYYKHLYTGKIDKVFAINFIFRLLNDYDLKNSIPYSKIFDMFIINQLNYRVMDKDLQINESNIKPLQEIDYNKPMCLNVPKNIYDIIRKNKNFLNGYNNVKLVSYQNSKLPQAVKNFKALLDFKHISSTGDLNNRIIHFNKNNKIKFIEFNKNKKVDKSNQICCYILLFL